MTEEKNTVDAKNSGNSEIETLKKQIVGLDKSNTSYQKKVNDLSLELQNKSALIEKLESENYDLKLAEKKKELLKEKGLPHELFLQYITGKDEESIKAQIQGLNDNLEKFNHEKLEYQLAYGTYKPKSAVKINDFSYSSLRDLKDAIDTGQVDPKDPRTIDQWRKLHEGES